MLNEFGSLTILSRHFGCSSLTHGMIYEEVDFAVICYAECRATEQVCRLSVDFMYCCEIVH
jgi:hypothetical protein